MGLEKNAEVDLWFADVDYGGGINVYVKRGRVAGKTIRCLGRDFGPAERYRSTLDVDCYLEHSTRELALQDLVNRMVAKVERAKVALDQAERLLAKAHDFVARGEVEL